MLQMYLGRPAVASYFRGFKMLHGLLHEHRKNASEHQNSTFQLYTYMHAIVTLVKGLPYFVHI